MKCEAFHELAAAYALDALSEQERVECLHHLREEGPHDGCEALVARYERAVAALATALPPQPVAPGIWRAIEVRLGLDAPSVPARRSTWREPLAWAAAAIALLAGLWGAQSGRVARRERERTEQALTHTGSELATALAARTECAAALAQLTGPTALGRDAVSLLEHPATKIAPMAPAGAQPYRATALYNPELKRALVVSTGLSRTQGKDYELWVIAKGEAPRPAGFVRFDPGGVALGEFDAQLLQARPAALAVSLEPEGGRPTPTEVILVANLQG